MTISNQLIIILLCVFHFFIKKLKKPPMKVKTQIKVEKTQEPPKPNKQQSQPLLPEVAELQELLQKKNQIQSTVEQFNNPSTFARYSKMKRQLTKMDSRIKQLRLSIDSQPTKTTTTTTESETKKVQQEKNVEPVNQSPQEVKKQGQSLMPAWFGIFFNIVIMSLSLTMSTNVLPNWSEFPLSWLTDEEGRANCILVYFAFKMIIN